MALALVRDLREHRVPASAEELAGFETDVLAGFSAAPGWRGTGWKSRSVRAGWRWCSGRSMSGWTGLWR